jgi:hypothetical protein
MKKRDVFFLFEKVNKNNTNKNYQKFCKILQRKLDLLLARSGELSFIVEKTAAASSASNSPPEKKEEFCLFSFEDCLQKFSFSSSFKTTAFAAARLHSHPAEKGYFWREKYEPPVATQTLPAS